MSTETPQTHAGFKPLPNVLNRNGITLRQIKRTLTTGMYSAGGRGFEVFRIRTQKGGKIGDNVIAPSEVYPSNEDFGRIAWYYMPGQEREAEACFVRLESATPGHTEGEG